MAANFGGHNLQRSYDYSTVICTLRLDARVQGWHRIVKEVLNSIHGVNNFKMNPNGLVEVSGMVHPNLLLERIWRTGMHAEIVSVQSGNYSGDMHTFGRGGDQAGHDYRGYGGYTTGFGRHGGVQCGDRFGGGLEFAACNDRSYGGGYQNHPPASSFNRPFAGLAESIIRPPSSPIWFWH